MKPFAIPSTAYTHLPSIRAAYARAHPQQGFVLTELVIAALIFGIFALGVAFAYNLYVATSSINTTLDNSNIINAAMKTQVGAPNYSTTDYGLMLAKSKAFDTSAYGVTISGTTATITNRWGGAVTVIGNNNSYQYTEPNVPEQVCVGLLPKLQLAAWSSVKVGATTVPVPVTAALAATTCNGTANITLTSNG